MECNCHNFKRKQQLEIRHELLSWGLYDIKDISMSLLVILQTFCLQSSKLHKLSCDKTSFIATVLIEFQLCPSAVCVYFGAVNDVVCCLMYVPCL